MQNKKLEDLTARSIKMLTGEEAIHVNIMMACEEFFAIWTEELFPALRSAGKNRYQYVAALLRDCGYENATEKLVRTYFDRIRARRNIKADVEYAVPEFVRTPVRVAPVGSGGPVTAVTPSVTPTIAKRASVMSVVSPVAVELDEAYLIEHYRRLEAQKNADVQEWTGDDEALYLAINELLDKSFVNKRNTDQCLEVLERANGLYPDIWGFLRSKRMILGIQS